jgi:hypothetical protein
MNPRVDSTGFEGTEVLFFPLEEGSESHELLLYDEGMIRDSGGRDPFQKGKKLLHRVKNWYEQSAVELYAGDRFVRRVGYFKKIKVLLTRPIEKTVVKAKLQQMLRDRSYHHLRWMAIDLLLMPATILTIVLPGPNIPFYYLAFRVYSHWRSYRSASKTVLQNVEVEVSTRASEVNALFAGNADMKGALKELRRKYGLRAFQEHHFVPLKTQLKEVWLRLKHHFS